MHSGQRAGGAAALIIAWTILGMAAGRDAKAFESHVVSLTVGAAKASGPANLAAAVKKPDTVVELLASNLDREHDALVEFPVCSHDKVPTGLLVPDLEAILQRQVRPRGERPASDPGWAACFRPGTPAAFLVPRGQTVRMKVGLDFRALGSQHIAIVGTVRTLGSGEGGSASRKRTKRGSRAQALAGAELGELLRLPVAAEAPVSLFYAVEETSKGVAFRRATYAELYLRNQPTGEDGGAESGEYVDGQLPVAVDEFLTYRPLVPDRAEYDPNHVDLRYVSTQSGGPDGESMCIKPDRDDCQSESCRNTISRGTPNAAARAALYTISGRFSVKWTDHTLHPGWGWRAVAWWDNGGDWVKLTEDWVQWDGSYQLFVNHDGYTGQNLRVQFRAYNRFIEPRDADDGLYRWRNPDKQNIAVNHDEGHRYADCDGGDANGLGEMYFRAYLVWSKMYWDAEINPLRADPIKAYYPNTTYDCGNGDGVPWSCANTTGTIWLIPTHGTNLGTVPHELGHQINYEFWDNKLPAGAGGPHSSSNCYNQGIALTEGYGNFMSVWVQTNRSAVPAAGIRPFNTEDPGAGVCKTPGNSNEAWVAATFWDLHDSRSDGDDVLWFIHPGAVHALFLGNPIANDGDAFGMDDLRTTYRDAATDGHEPYIDDIFAQNDTD